MPIDKHPPMLDPDRVNNIRQGFTSSPEDRKTYDVLNQLGEQEDLSKIWKVKETGLTHLTVNENEKISPEIVAILKPIFHQIVKKFSEENKDVSTPDLKSYKTDLLVLWKCLNADGFSVREKTNYKKGANISLKLNQIQDLDSQEVSSGGISKIIYPENGGSVKQCHLFIHPIDLSNPGNYPSKFADKRGFQIDFFLSDTLINPENVAVEQYSKKAGLGIRVFENGSMAAVLQKYVGNSNFELKPMSFETQSNPHRTVVNYLSREISTKK